MGYIHVNDHYFYLNHLAKQSQILCRASFERENINSVKIVLVPMHNNCKTVENLFNNVNSHDLESWHAPSGI